MNKTPLTKIERSIVEKLSHATFPPATASKRIVRDLSSGHVKQLSKRGREFLAFVAHRFRRQWQATPKEWAWVLEHLALPASARSRASRPTQRSERVPREHLLPPRAEIPDPAKWLRGTLSSERALKSEAPAISRKGKAAGAPPIQLQLF